MKPIDFWKECISEAADSCTVALTPEQLTTIAETVEGAHDNYGLAFYSPPSSDRFAEIEREHKAAIKRLEARHEQYRSNAEKAVREALAPYSSGPISIGEYGEVFLHGGRTTQLQ